jgi:hypothetical protein
MIACTMFGVRINGLAFTDNAVFVDYLFNGTGVFLDRIGLFQTRYKTRQITHPDE